MALWGDAPNRTCRRAAGDTSIDRPVLVRLPQRTAAYLVGPRIKQHLSDRRRPQRPKFSRLNPRFCRQRKPPVRVMCSKATVLCEYSWFPRDTLTVKRFRLLRPPSAAAHRRPLGRGSDRDWLLLARSCAAPQGPIELGHSVRPCSPSATARPAAPRYPRSCQPQSADRRSPFRSCHAVACQCGLGGLRLQPPPPGRD
jgi:hypothetical protein